MAPTPSKSNLPQGTYLRTPISKHRLHLNPVKPSHPSPNPNSTAKETASADHPVEVIGRIRDFPERREKPISVLQVNPDHQTIRVRSDFGYRDFSLDGVSLSEEEAIDGFYRKFVESRINGVKLGEKCTIMMYGPTGSGKSHTMFGCSKQPGIVYRSLRDILGEADEEDDENKRPSVGTFVQVTVLEIYNEEIYDLLSNGGGGFGLGWPKGSGSKARLEVMGKKAKNATFISGNAAAKISKEIQKVEKRRIVKSTLCNERSSRSHCMIILDVPTVGGRLMLVDMAGSENIEQAGQSGFEAKMQTAKINQGNIALKRVVESIANGDSHVPFRDSKLTMLLQDSFEDDKSKILMILCASPDPKEIHKTISTLEYGAKAKCIVRGPHTPIKDKLGSEDSSSAVILGSRIAAMDQFIYKLQMENKLREKERNEAHRELVKKEEEVSALRAKLDLLERKEKRGASEEEINLKVIERTCALKEELEKKLEECQRMANEFVDLEKRRMEERMVQQQKEVEMLRQRLEEIELELGRSRDANGEPKEIEGSGFMKKLSGIHADEETLMVKSMDLDTGDQEMAAHDERRVDATEGIGGYLSFLNNSVLGARNEEIESGFVPKYGEKVCLSTVFEEEEVEEEEDAGQKDGIEDEEVEKEIIEEKRVCSSSMVGNNSNPMLHPGSFSLSPHLFERDKHLGSSTRDAASSRQLIIQNIFTLCGNYREIAHSTPLSTISDGSAGSLSNENSQAQGIISSDLSMKTIKEKASPPFSPQGVSSVKLAKEEKPEFFQMNNKQILDKIDSKENIPTDDQTDVYVKWEAASKANPGKLITTLKVPRTASLADLRKLIEIHLGADQQAFTFLVLGDPSGAPVSREKEATLQASKLPICNSGHLACLRPAKGMQPPNHHAPLTPLQNRLPLTPNVYAKEQQGDGFSTNLGSTPYITTRKHKPSSDIIV